MKTEHELLRAAGDYIAQHGFSNQWSEYRADDGPRCGCFMHAIDSALWPFSDRVLKRASRSLTKVIGSGMSVNQLMRAGWTGPEVTGDAAAACYIAADIAEAEGR